VGFWQKLQKKTTTVLQSFFVVNIEPTLSSCNKIFTLCTSKFSVHLAIVYFSIILFASATEYEHILSEGYQIPCKYSISRLGTCKQTYNITFL